MIVGYARVSTEGKTVDAQMKQLRDAGAEKILGGVSKRLGSLYWSGRHPSWVKGVKVKNPAFEKSDPSP